MRTTSVISTVLLGATAVLAAQTPLIPIGISDKCTTFLTQLNTDAALAQCTKSLLTATKAYSASNSTSKSNSDNLATALATLSGPNSGCSDTVVRSQLTSFYAQCPDELTGPNKNDVVQSIYDALYVINPLQSAICAKDSSTNKYCVMQIGTGSGTNGTVANAVSNVVSTTSAAIALVKEYISIPLTSGDQKLSKRAAPGTVLVANATTWNSAFLPYLFLSPNSSASVLCTPCGKSVLTAYAQWEAKMPYSFGLNNSPLLSGQVTLWASMTEKCGTDFMASVATGAGAGSLGAIAMAGSASATSAMGKVVAVVALAAGGMLMSL